MENEMKDVSKSIIALDSTIGDVQYELEKLDTITNMIFKLSNPEDYPRDTSEVELLSAAQALLVIKDINNLTALATDQINKINSTLEEAHGTTDDCISRLRKA